MIASYIFAFDFETYRITDYHPFPPAVCLSYVREVNGAVDYGVVPWQVGLQMVAEAAAAGALFVGANTAFDAMVAAYNSPNVEAAVQWWQSMTEAGRVTDVLLRQRLLDGAVDDYLRLKRYSLATVTERWCGVTLDKGKDNPDHWRLRYGELDGVPIEQWPREAYDYALLDAWYTYQVFKAQEAARYGAIGYDGVDYRKRFPNHDALIDETRQQMKALALADLAATGMVTNPETVAKFRAWLEGEVERLRPILVQAGLVRTEYKLNTEAVAASFRAAGVEVPLTPTGKPSLTKARYKQLTTDDPLHLTAKVNGQYSWPESAPYLAATHPQWVNVKHVRCTDRVQLGVQLTFLYLDEEEPNCAEPKQNDPPGKVYWEKTDADNCDRSGHPTLIAYARYSSLTKNLGSDIEILEQASRSPFHAHYVTLQSNGRTSTGSDGGEGTAGNLQNLPRTPGVRECWVPPPGWLFAEADSAAVELSAFGQIALWWIGWSECARMIQEGVDQHAVAGAGLLRHPDPKGTGWKELKAAKKAGDSAADGARTGGKGINFGCKAKMSAKRYKTYAWNNYGLKLTLAEAQRHIDLHNELILEMAPYSAHCETFARDPGKYGSKYDLVHPWSGRLRADLRYTDVHNYPFSGLAQDMAGVYLWDLFKARWGASPQGRADAFYGCRPCLFTHDSVVALVPDDPDRATAAAERLGQIMTEAARKVMPDVGSTADATLLRQLSKKADDPKKDLDGRLVVWDCWAAAKADLSAPRRDPGLSDAAWLQKRSWPPYVIQDITGETPHV